MYLYEIVRKLAAHVLLEKEKNVKTNLYVQRNCAPCFSKSFCKTFYKE